MPSIQYTLPFNKNSDLVLSPTELKETYLFGVPILDPATGQEMDNETVKFYIQSAQSEVEKYLNLKLNKQIIDEQKDFMLDDFQSWALVRVTYPVVEAHELKGFISDVQQIAYPKEWISSRKTSDGYLYHRNIYLIPGSSAAQTNAIVYSGISPHLGYFGQKQIPNYWRVKYCTGFDQVPKDIINIIGKKAAVQIFNILGDLILGAGIANTSIGIDGLSQSVASTASASYSGYGARISIYQKEIDSQLPLMKDYYRGITFMGM